MQAALDSARERFAAANLANQLEQRGGGIGGIVDRRSRGGEGIDGALQAVREHLEPRARVPDPLDASRQDFIGRERTLGGGMPPARGGPIGAVAPIQGARLELAQKLLAGRQGPPAHAPAHGFRRRMFGLGTGRHGGATAPGAGGDPSDASRRANFDQVLQMQRLRKPRRSPGRAPAGL